MEEYFRFIDNRIIFPSQEIFDKVFTQENFTVIRPKSALDKADITVKRHEPNIFDSDANDNFVLDFLKQHPYKYEKIYHCYNLFDNDSIPLGYITIKEHNNYEGYIFLAFSYNFIYWEQKTKHFPLIQGFDMFTPIFQCYYVKKYNFNSSKKDKFSLIFYCESIANSQNILKKLKELFELKKNIDLKHYIQKNYVKGLHEKSENKIKEHQYYKYNDEVLTLIRENNFEELEKIGCDYYGTIPSFENVSYEAFIDTKENDLIINAEFECNNEKLLLQRRGSIKWENGKILSCEDDGKYQKIKYPKSRYYQFDKDTNKYVYGCNVLDSKKYPLSSTRMYYELSKILKDKLNFETYFDIINNSKLDLTEKCVYSLKTLEKVKE